MPLLLLPLYCAWRFFYLSTPNPPTRLQHPNDVHISCVFLNVFSPRRVFSTPSDNQTPRLTDADFTASEHYCTWQNTSQLQALPTAAFCWLHLVASV